VLSEKIALLELEKERASFERAQKLHEQAIMTKEEFEQARLRRDAAEETLERSGMTSTSARSRPLRRIVTALRGEGRSSRRMTADLSSRSRRPGAPGARLRPEWALFA